MNLHVKGLLFDMDGTLVNSHSIVIKAWSQFAKKYQLNLAEILAVSHGRPAIETIKLFTTNAINQQHEADLIDKINLLEHGECAIDGALEFLLKLKPESWGIVTSASFNLAKKRLGEACIPIPSVLITEEQVVLGKPHPEGYLKAAQLLGISPNECVIFEDAPAGVMAANAAKIPVIIVGDDQHALSLPHIAQIISFNEIQLNCVENNLYHLDRN